MNSPNGNLPEAPKNLRRICPFLGVMDDPETSLAFPSEINYCFAAEPPGIPKIDHQVNRCLALTHLGCPVYSAKEKGPLPAEFRLKANGGLHINMQAPWIVRSIGAFVIATLIFFIGWFGVSGLTRSANERGAEKTQPVLPILPTSTPPVPLPTQTIPSSILPVSPSASETPTAQVVSTLKPQPPQTSCGRPAGWVNYVVQPNDTLSRLSLATGVTIAQLQNANCMGASTLLHVGRVLFVPYGISVPVNPPLQPTSPYSTYVPTNTFSSEWTVTQESTVVIATEIPTENVWATTEPTP